MDSSKFLGVGLKNLILIWMVLTVFSLMAKVILTKHPIDGFSQVIQAA
jgi:hypothetical protein